MQYCALQRNALTLDECARVIAMPQGAGLDGTLGISRIGTSIFWIPCGAETAWLFDRARAIADEANRRFWNFDISPPMQSLQLSHYAAAGKYDWHMDVGPGPMSYRKLSVVVQLTPPATGDLEVFTIGALRLEIGDAAVFPSFVMHRATPAVIDRWSIASWLLGPEPFK